MFLKYCTCTTHEVDFVDAPVFGQIFELHEHALERHDDDGGQDTLKHETVQSTRFQILGTVAALNKTERLRYLSKMRYLH